MTIRDFAQISNGGSALATLFALVAEFNPDTANISTYAFGLFLILFKAKTTFDDYAYFSTANFSYIHVRIGLLISLLFWVLLGISAAQIDDLENSYLFMLLSVCVGTGWIIVDAFRAGAYREQYLWIAFNAGYAAILGILIWLHITKPIIQFTAIVILIVILVGDFLVSRSFDNAESGADQK